MADTIKTLNGYAFDAEKLGGKSPEYYLPPKNLIVNGNFKNPVNQRGQSDYSFDDGYTIDRWRLYWNGDGRVSVKNGYIELFRESHSAYLFQHMANVEEMVGKTYTVAAKCRYNGTVGWIDSTQRVGLTVRSLDWIIATHTFTVGSSTSDVHGQAAVEISSASDLSFEVEWIALYEGSYTAETLPPFVPKEYAVEMAECMRYLQVFGSNVVFAGCVNGGATSVNFTIPNKTDFRALPSVDDSGITEIILKAASSGSNFTLTDDMINHNAASTKTTVTLSIPNPNAEKYPSHSAVNVNIDGKLLLTADL